MADSEEVSSSTPLFSEGHHYQPEPEPEPQLDPGPGQELFNPDDIVDLVGGAQDALERHRAEGESGLQEPTVTSTRPEPVREPEPEPEPEPVREPEPETVQEQEPEPQTVREPEPEPVQVYEPEPVPIREPQPETVFLQEDVPEPESFKEPEPVLLQKSVPKPEPVKEPEPEHQAPEQSEVVAPGAEAGIPGPAPPAEPPAPQSDALLAAAAREAAPSPAEAAAQPAVTQEPLAPASYASSPAKAQPLLLMQLPTELGQKGDSPAPISPISPLHSPDSLEELSLTESPNQPPPPGSAAPLGSFSTTPPNILSKNMPWDGEEGDSGPGCGKAKEDLLDSLAAPYLSLGKDSGPHNPCEDSGISFSPEEKMISSDRSSTGPSPVNPLMMVHESHLTSSNPTEHWDSPFLSSEVNSKVSMDSFTKDTTPISSSRYEPDVCGNQSDEDEDLNYEVKKNNNPFDGYSPLADSGYSHFGESKSDTKMSESPTPDLVQYRQTGESQENQPSILDEGKLFETTKRASEALLESMNQFSSGLKEGEEEEEEDEEDSVLPPSLPDILKSSPLNPDKVDSGSSEGSPEEQSPILERRMMESPNPPINLSANNPFAFDTKVSLLKEMTEEMEARSADGTTVEDSKSFGDFDLVKEAEETTPPKVKAEEPVQIEQKDWFSSNDSPKKPERFEPLDFQSKKTTAEDSDSESPTADSLSPVLEAMAKNPASFQVETEKKDLKMELEEPEVAEEVSEHEVSSEEFEFIERPPRGVIDEFLEALDPSKFSSPKPPEIPLDDDLGFGLKDTPAAVEKVPEPEALSQSSYHLLTQASPQKTKAELETPPSQAPPTRLPAENPEQPAPQRSTAGSKLFKMPNLNIRAVVELVYWRDVKTTGVVFGAALLLLLSLSVCSIVSVCSYIGLALLSVTICFRIYKGILQAIQKSDEGHPFKLYLDQEVALSADLVHKYSDGILEKLNWTIKELRRLFLVEDLVDSVKFAILMWILTYVGALFNGLTLLILGLVGAFSCPIIYEKHQAQIDHYLALVTNQVKDIVEKIQEKVPGLKRKAE
ncbi:reticulon-4-like isoform X1 [Poecilia formosa]|uniref:reticulon-4-like isoform X1 n=2 Tax=Poecilia formosa TaxID=48698 RepID=UPI000444273F|nr:PREDICTED: reticulon-4-like isoform X1 [Poecilia formosa]XP_016518952.1 PREDICTED: reticulon-4-like isoform X1 [Poecilia formosa]